MVNSSMDFFWNIIASQEKSDEIGTNLLARCMSHRNSRLFRLLLANFLISVDLYILYFVLHNMIHPFYNSCTNDFVQHWFHFQVQHVTFSSWSWFHVRLLHEQELVFPLRVTSKVPLLSIQYEVWFYIVAIQLKQMKAEGIKIH